MHITKETRQEIANLITRGYNKGFAKEGEGKTIIWEIEIRLDR